MNFTGKCLLLGAVSAMSMSQAHDDPLSFYFSIGGGHQSVSFDYSDKNYKFQGATSVVSGGIRYQFDDHYGLVFGMGNSWGSIDKQHIANGGVNYLFNAKGALATELQPSYFWNYNSRIFAVLGASAYKFDIYGHNKSRISTKPCYGAGVEVKISKEFSVIGKGVISHLGDHFLPASGGVTFSAQNMKANKLSLELAYTL